MQMWCVISEKKAVYTDFKRGPQNRAPSSDPFYIKFLLIFPTTSSWAKTTAFIVSTTSFGVRTTHTWECGFFAGMNWASKKMPNASLKKRIQMLNLPLVLVSDAVLRLIAYPRLTACLPNRSCITLQVTVTSALYLCNLNYFNHRLKY